MKQAQAQVDQALLNLSYTRITAPTTGIVNKKNVDIGANLSVGQDLMKHRSAPGPLGHRQLQGNATDQNASLRTGPDEGRRARWPQVLRQVSQIGGATGSKLSLFPPENATGNYVKVVQRIPVRIDFTNLQQENGDYALRPGMSVTPDVAIKGPGDDKSQQNCNETAKR